MKAKPPLPQANTVCCRRRERRGRDRRKEEEKKGGGEGGVEGEAPPQYATFVLKQGIIVNVGEGRGGVVMCILFAFFRN
jgi:hypothetical protein